MAILIFFLAHWYLSLFCQTFFLHRYSSHKMCTMTKGWERCFYFLTFLSQGSSFLNPRAYAIMHRMHHEYSDTEKDPHSPQFFKDVWSLMMNTKKVYYGLVTGTLHFELKFRSRSPRWRSLDRFSDRWSVRIAFGVLYFLFYYFFATHWWMYALLPVHFLMGPIHGAIVNWGGHKYGYQNFDNGDHSHNTLPVDFVTGGELMQNNHHKNPGNPNFAQKWYEIDPGYQVMRLFNWLGIITLRRM